MATAGEVAGKLIRLQISTDAGVSYTEVGCTTEDGFTTDSDTDDSACKDDGGWNTPIVTTQGFELNLTGFVIYDSAKLNFYDLLTLKKDATVFLFKYGTTVTGDDVITGSAMITSISQGAAVDGKATYDVTLLGTGEFSTETNA